MNPPSKKNANTPSLRFRGFVGAWKRYKISDLLDFFPTNSLVWDQLDYGVGGVMNLHYGLIHGGLPTALDLGLSSLPSIKAEHLPSTHTLCLEGDILFADTSENIDEIGKAVELVRGGGLPLVGGLHTLHGRDKSCQTEVGFKGYAFAAPAFRRQIQRLAQGSKVYSLRRSSFSECVMAIPEKAEQQKMVALFTLLDARMATQNKIIGKLKSLMKGYYAAANKSTWKLQRLKDLLDERKESNSKEYPVFSVALHEGIINQVDHRGRSFAAKDTRKYKVVKPGDLVYTKSPNGDFPYGIVKQSQVQSPVAVSPFYGVFAPKNRPMGKLLHHYFSNPILANNYLHSLVQKGARNTINISASHFLDKALLLPCDNQEIENISRLLQALELKLQLEQKILQELKLQKSFLLTEMFV